MPRLGPRRDAVAFKLDDDGIEWTDARAREEGIVKGDGEPNRSELIRLAIEYARQHMPKGWRPA